MLTDEAAIIVEALAVYVAETEATIVIARQHVVTLSATVPTQQPHAQAAAVEVATIATVLV